MGSQRLEKDRPERIFKGESGLRFCVWCGCSRPCCAAHELWTKTKLISGEDRYRSGFRAFNPSECGKDGYPLEWHATLKHAVREAAGHRCVRCLHPYRNGEHGKGEWSPCDERCLHGDRDVRWLDRKGNWVPVPLNIEDVPRQARWRILTVHHLDGDKANCRWWNLAALCQRCHLQIQGKVQMARVWPWEHSDWFKPYVAGYYAWTYLGEDLAREDVDLRLDELLALERQAA